MNLLDEFTRQLTAAFDNVRPTLHGQYAIAAALDGDVATVRRQLAELTPEQRDQVREAARLVARTVKHWPREQ